MVFQSNTGKRFLVPQTSTGMGSIGSPVHYWEMILDYPVHAILGKGSISSQVQYWEKVLQVSQSTPGKRFYRFPSPVLGKGSIGSPVQY